MQKTSFTIRRATHADAEAIAATHANSITTVASKFYTPEVIAAWCAPCIAPRYTKAMDGGEEFFIAVSENEETDSTLGFSSYRLEASKHRTALYVRGDATRKGIGRALFEAAEAAARRGGADEIYVDASLAAVAFYKACGFNEIGRGTHLMMNGAPMECVFMRKVLTPR